MESFFATFSETHPHDSILLILFNTGSIGLMFYIGMSGRLIKYFRNNMQNKITSMVLGNIA